MNVPSQAAKPSPLRAAVTGATGFVGAALIEQLLQQSWSISALARDPSKFEYSTSEHQPRVRVVAGDLNDKTALADLAKDASVFFHLAGVTHARRPEGFHDVNVTGAQNAARAAKAVGATFIHASSMSARKPDVSPYAQSKFDSEAAVAQIMESAPWLALRLPAIYGPRDLVTLPFFKLIKSGLALAPRTNPPARASILYVADAAAALIAAAQTAPPGAVYEVGDERADGFAWTEIGSILGEVLGRRPKPLAVPRPVISLYHGAVRTIEGALGRNPSVREGQINEFFHPDWVARDNLLSDSCAWRPTTTLNEGFAKTARWYQDNGLL